MTQEGFGGYFSFPANDEASTKRRVHVLQQARVSGLFAFGTRLLSISTIACLAGCHGKPEAHEIWTSEAAIRTTVTSSQLPVFRGASQVPHGISVLVALVTLHSDGSKPDVGIIESPSTSASAAVIDALQHWRFGWRSEVAGDVLKGRITFYIVNTENGISVFNSDTAPSFVELRAERVKLQSLGSR